MHDGRGGTSVRWDGDTRGRGVGDAAAFADGARELIDAMREPGWVAEGPGEHLLPHLTAACEQLPLEVGPTHVVDDGTYEVDLRWTREASGVGEVRAAVYALLGTFAETATYVRQRREDGVLTFEVVTGLLGDSQFAPHGHALRLRIALP
jgi:hypothetical protein